MCRCTQTTCGSNQRAGGGGGQVVVGTRRLVTLSHRQYTNLLQFPCVQRFSILGFHQQLVRMCWFCYQQYESWSVISSTNPGQLSAVRILVSYQQYESWSVISSTNPGQLSAVRILVSYQQYESWSVISSTNPGQLSAVQILVSYQQYESWSVISSTNPGQLLAVRILVSYQQYESWSVISSTNPGQLLAVRILVAVNFLVISQQCKSWLFIPIPEQSCTGPIHSPCSQTFPPPPIHFSRQTNHHTNYGLNGRR